MKISKSKMRQKRKGFSLVELVVVIAIMAILAVSVFAGGSAAIKKSQVSRTTSDLHNFSIAIESALNETPKVATITNSDAAFADVLKAVNGNLSADYQLTEVSTDSAGNIVTKIGGSSSQYHIYQSQKTDAWDNNYYVIFDSSERHDKGNSDFYITVISAGPNAQTTIGPEKDSSLLAGIDSDDIFLLVQYTNGDVAATTYDVSSTEMKNGSGTELKTTEKGTQAGSNQGYYIGTAANNTDGSASMCPVNF